MPSFENLNGSLELFVLVFQYLWQYFSFCASVHIPVWNCFTHKMKFIWNTEYSNGRYFLWLVFLCVGQFQKYLCTNFNGKTVHLQKAVFPMKIIKKKIFKSIWALGNFLSHLSEIGNPLKLALEFHSRVLNQIHSF